jgi:5'-nucleotidase
MRILVVNDDGIKAPGIKRLVQMAAGLGEVWVVAPAAQCSAMSHRITVRGDLEVKPYDFPAAGVTAYSVWGTPADCVKVALGCLMTEKPDIVFSGINAGYNVGRDILYSGTIGAAMEALCWGVPAIAFSVAEEEECEVLNTYLEPVAKELISKTLPQNEIWNVNFPGCTLKESCGIVSRIRTSITGITTRERTDRTEAVFFQRQGCRKRKRRMERMREQFFPITYPSEQSKI